MQRSTVVRRGSYATLFAFAVVGFIGFGAIAVDISMLRLADAEIQAVADAAAQAGVLELRRSDDRIVASDVAAEVIAANQVAGAPPVADAMVFGVFEGGSFSPSNLQANAIQVDVTLGLDLPFSSFWGSGIHNLRGSAIAAARPLHVVVAVDITNSWSLDNFLNARDGALAVFDHVTAAASNADRIGCAIFYGKYGLEYTPLMLAKDAVAAGVRDEWDLLRPASIGCPGGDKCAPWMPAQYGDETGTDHAIGIDMATKMFSEYPDPSVYRAMIVVTDGKPANVGPHQTRTVAEREAWQWRHVFTGEQARTVDEIKVESVAMAQQAWDEAEVHTWMVSFEQDDQWMRDTAQGDGYFIRTDNSDDLVTIFADIAESLPVTLVE